ncbi:hypothetical protein TTHERM_00877000 (macronuclear) [Tetrahymena thermophila SB210]|uniref:Uncharacterized protein n=1 Tax=Tetrahymena thermophila (strain SB210) TaxID=312017 RepID=Q23H42_TETTS|nr:hypothetical protein TTHERM_00877000 [Tetrahymena thermophila SB210]EAR95805.3 hypothetical protein TTHERM_00877000 [Tetrahymena thermophila SB210]|eukprot:XP_001016050.3 hypothetical protein TTHERM_00877000 [Tetrahymena thermophila SB210]
MSRTKDVFRDETNNKHNQSLANEQKNNTTILETSGILDAYEYFLRQLCKNGLPSGNVYEFAAQQILKFERKRNNEIKKRVALKNSLEALENQQTNQQDQTKENKISKSPEKKNQTKGDESKKGQLQVQQLDTPTVSQNRQNQKSDVGLKSPSAGLQQQVEKKGQEKETAQTSKKDLNKKK